MRKLRLTVLLATDEEAASSETRWCQSVLLVQRCSVWVWQGRARGPSTVCFHKPSIGPGLPAQNTAVCCVCVGCQDTGDLSVTLFCLEKVSFFFPFEIIIFSLPWLKWLPLLIQVLFSHTSHCLKTKRHVGINIICSGQVLASCSYGYLYFLKALYLEIINKCVCLYCNLLEDMNCNLLLYINSIIL